MYSLLFSKLFSSDLHLLQKHTYSFVVVAVLLSPFFYVGQWQFLLYGVDDRSRWKNTSEDHWGMIATEESEVLTKTGPNVLCPLGIP
jgi:hypothetical protein